MELIRSGGRSGEITEAERWAAVVGGGLLAIYGLTRRDRSGVLFALMGGGIAWQGIDGRSPFRDGIEVRRATTHDPEFDRPGEGDLRAERVITLERPVEDVFQAWRRLEAIPRFMERLESVLPLGGNRFRWTVRAPIGTVEWDTEMVDERDNEWLAWRSSAGSGIDHDGVARFGPGPGGAGTTVRMSLVYRPAAGPWRRVLEYLLADEPAPANDELDRVRQAMDAGLMSEGVATGGGW
jgi:uncharacterized membrane protein